MERPDPAPRLDGNLILLGTGTSVGVPALGCSCAVCTSNDPHNQRTRSAAICGLPEGNLLIDTPPDLRTQLLRERIGRLHAVAYTHEHADHLFGLDDLRLFPFYLGHPVPLYCEERVERRIRHSFDYAFASRTPSHPGAVPQLEFHRLTTDPMRILGATITPLRFHHGADLEVLGFRIGQVAYCTDVSGVPEATWPRLEHLEVLILSALRRRPHPTHLSLAQAIEIAQRVGARQTYFTHVSHDLDYQATNAELPPGIRLAHDGLTIPLGGPLDAPAPGLDPGPGRA